MDPTASAGPGGSGALDLDNLDGPQIEAVVEAIRRSFNESQFGMLLSHRLGMKLDELATSGRPYPERVFQVVEESQRKGFGRQLIEAVEAERPNVERVKALRDKLALARPNASSEPLAPQSKRPPQPAAIASSSLSSPGPSIFISYAREQIEQAKELAADLSANGYMVWWDHLIHAGTDFDRYIRERITAADAVVVIWSDEAAASPYVKGEARLGVKLEKLIPVKVGHFDLQNLPLDFQTYHTAELADQPSLLSALEARAGKPQVPDLPKGHKLTPQEPNPLPFAEPELLPPKVPEPELSNKPETVIFKEHEPEPELSNEPETDKDNPFITIVRKTYTAIVALAVIVAIIAIVWHYWQQSKPFALEDTFSNPTYKEKARLDVCYSWGKFCGQRAADTFCWAQGYDRATNFTTERFRPTRLASNGEVCDADFCVGFKSITCFIPGSERLTNRDWP